jgi:hypothetical protein
MSEISREFECSQWSAHRERDDSNFWPHAFRANSDAAIAKLLEKHPGVNVAEDNSACLDETHDRYPDSMKKSGKFILLRTVKLDRAVVVQEGH